MLNAFTRGKSTIWRWYSISKGHGENEERARVTAEDEITSLVFGPLQYMQPKEVTEFWRALLRYGGDENTTFLPCEAPMRCDVEFWPRKIVGEPERRKYVEPDLLIDLVWPNDLRRRILIELKWDSVLSGKDQLKKQRNFFLRGFPKDSAIHIFIGKDTSEAYTNPNVLSFSWRDMQDVLNAGFHSHPSVALSCWAVLTSDFLGKVITEPFKGFDHKGIHLPGAENWNMDFYSGGVDYFGKNEFTLSGELSGFYEQ